MTKKFYHVLAVMALCLIAIVFTPSQLKAAIGETFTKDQLKYTIYTEDKATKTGTVSVEAESKEISGDIVIPEFVENGEYIYEVTILPDGAFSSCKYLGSIVIPNGITSIGESAFAWCSILTYVTIPDNVTSIASWAFCNCNLLSIIHFKGDAPKLEPNVFSDSKYITIYYQEEKKGWNSSWLRGIPGIECKGLIEQNGVIYAYRSDNTATYCVYTNNDYTDVV